MATAVKKLMTKAAAQRSQHANGSYARWSAASVDTNEADGRWYDGCDVDHKRMRLWNVDAADGIVRRKPKRLSNQRYTQGEQHVVVPASVPVAANARDGKSAASPVTNERLQMQEIYNRYVAVYDKVSTTRRRKSYHRKPATIMQGVNDALEGRSRGGSLVERMLREVE